MRVVITGGGTGGHVYPALAVAEVLTHNKPSVTEQVDLLFIGSSGGMERELVNRAGIPFVGVQAGALRGKSPIQFLLGIVRMASGLLESISALRRFRADAILATGGYVGIPVVLAGWSLRVPSVLFLPDIRPGWAIKFLSRFASFIAVTNQASSRFLPERKVVVTGYPVRSEFLQVDKNQARKQLGLDPDLKTLLVWGGSRGAHSINVAISNSLLELLPLCQIVHLSGKTDAFWLEEVRARLPEGLRKRYFLYGYLHEQFTLAVAAADLAVSRAGASIMGEFPAVGLPSILVPYPYAGAHQELNAEVMVKAGAATRIDDKDLENLAAAVRQLLEHEDKLQQMASSARMLATPDASKRIISLLNQVSRKTLADYGGQHV